MPTPIERDELAAKLAAGTIRLVDAQGPGWFEREHLPGALPASVEDVEELLATLGPDLDIEIAVYCYNSACTGSAYAAEQLEVHGYRDVRRYIGGKQDWIDAGLPLESTDR